MQSLNWTKLAVSVFLLCFTFFSNTIFADQLIMKNGDVISGTVAKVAAGKVTITPPYAGAIEVRIDAVESIKADKEFEVELSDGSQINARLDLNAGKQVLRLDGNEKSLNLNQLVAARKPKVYFERSSQIDVNLTANGGNTESRSSLIFADTKLRLGKHRHIGALTYRRDETEGIKTKQQDLLNYQYNWIFSEPWYTGVSASYESDPIRDLSHRYTLGVIFGRDVIDNATQILSISFGAGVSDEKIAALSESGSVGLWNLLYEQDLFAGKIKFYHNDKLTYHFYADNNAIFKSNTGLQFNLLKNIYAKVSLRYDYETEPAIGASNDDTTFAIGVGAEF